MSLAGPSSEYFPAIEEELRRAVGSEQARRRQYLTRRGPAAPGDANPLPAGALREYYAMLEYHLGWANGSMSSGSAVAGGSSAAGGGSAPSRAPFTTRRPVDPGSSDATRKRVCP